MARRLSFALLILTLLCPRLSAQGKLERVRQEVNKPATSEPASKDTAQNEGNKSGNDSESDTLSEAFSASLLAAVAALIHAKDERPSAFLPYPYAHDHPGYLWCTPPRSADPAVPRVPPDEWNVGGAGGRVWLDNGNDFNGLNRLGGQLFLDTSRGFGFRIDGNWFHERLSCGCQDNLFIGSALVTYRLIDHERFQFHLGLGCVLLSDPGQTKAGIDFSASFDAFPTRPLVLSGFADVGTLGSATYRRARGTVGYLIRKWEIFAGYDYQGIGRVGLYGPLAGARLWF